MSKKNVLLLCLSPLKPGGNDRKYSYFDGEEYFLTGFMTNEPPAKSVIERLHRSGERLDKIVMICSQTVSKETVLQAIQKSKLNEEKLGGLKEKEAACDIDMLAMTHQQCFEAVIRQFSEKTDSAYVTDPICFQPVDTLDYTEADQVAECAVRAACEVMADGNDVDLYIDFNGGQRYMAFMILSIANLMKARKVAIQDIMTMNYDNGPDGAVSIQSMKAVFGCIDLVSGITEYLNYGRIKTLKEYFEGCKNDKVRAILSSMEEFSHDMQLCRTRLIFERKGKLKEELESYLEDAKRNSRQDAFEILFSYVVQDILNGYGPLLKGDLPEVVRWCVEKEFIQQALTFFVERMPIYFFDTGLYESTQGERKEYDTFLNRCSELYIKNRGKDGKEKKLIQNYVSNFSNYDKKYSWMVSYLRNSKEMTSCFPDARLMRRMVSKGKMNWIEIPEEYKNLKLQREQLENARRNASKLLSYIDIGRAQTNDRNRAGTILIGYYLLKEQRNLTNHANDFGKAAWEYPDICHILLLCADILHG